MSRLLVVVAVIAVLMSCSAFPNRSKRNTAVMQNAEAQSEDIVTGECNVTSQQLMIRCVPAGQQGYTPEELMDVICEMLPSIPICNIYKKK